MFRVSLACSSGALKAQQSASMDKYGGNERVQTRATGFFRTKKINNYWYLITPEGHPFISIGVNGLRYKTYSDKQYSKNTKNEYNSKINFLNASIVLLKKWHFNTLGGWSDIDRTGKVERIPYTIILSLLAKATSFSDWKKMVLPDIFSTKFRASVIKNSKTILENHKKDPYLLGYFTDNELRFSWLLPKSGNRMYALDWYLGLKPGLAAGSEGRRAAVKFIRKRYNDNYKAFSANWKTNAKSFRDPLNKYARASPTCLFADHRGVRKAGWVPVKPVHRRYADRQAGPNRLISNDGIGSSRPDGARAHLFRRSLVILSI